MRQSLSRALSLVRPQVQKLLGRALAFFRRARGPEKSSLLAKPPQASAPWSKPLVKSRPPTLEQRYEVVQEEGLVDEAFFRLRREIYNRLDKILGPKLVYQQRAVFRETGRLAPDRHYFYLKAANETGILFERSGSGWVVSRAEKITGRDLFVRDGEALDRISLYLNQERQAIPRVRSAMFGGDLLPFAVYEQKVLEHLLK